MQPEQILFELDRIAKQSGQYEKFRDLLDYTRACFDPCTETYLISIDKFLRKFFRNRLSDYTGKERDLYYKLFEECVANLENIGYVGEGAYLTLQEHHICGGTADPINNKFPYRPVGINEDKLTLEKAKRARELAKIGGAFSILYGLEKGIIHVSLEPLDDDGNTIRDPMPLDENLNPIIDYKKSVDFPFRRD